jgi:hypothetical protein
MSEHHRDGIVATDHRSVLHSVQATARALARAARLVRRQTVAIRANPVHVVSRAASTRLTSSALAAAGIGKSGVSVAAIARDIFPVSWVVVTGGDQSALDGSGDVVVVTVGDKRMHLVDISGLLEQLVGAVSVLRLHLELGGHTGDTVHEAKTVRVSERS